MSVGITGSVKASAGAGETISIAREYRIGQQCVRGQDLSGVSVEQGRIASTHARVQTGASGMVECHQRKTRLSVCVSRWSGHERLHKRAGW